ncbi:MAG: ribbon-helix-helix protein, CopG family [Prosthecobacter sp.]
MTTISFKLPDAQARQLRSKARKARLSLSEFLRRQVGGQIPPSSVSLQRCRHTGANIFAPVSKASPLTTESVREMLADFP